MTMQRFNRGKLFLCFTCLITYVSLVLFTLINVRLPNIFAPPKRRVSTGSVPAWYEPNHRVRRRSLSLWKSDEIARAIEEQQNPVNCTSKPYMVLHHPASGLGSLVHVASAFLAHAWEQDHVLVLAPDFAAGWTDGQYCQGSHSLECFFQPLTACAPSGQLPAGAVTVDVGDEDVVNKIPKAWHDAFQRDVDLRSALPGADRDVGVKYWWRAQSAAYLLRLNARTSNHLTQQRKWLAEHGVIPMPLPPNTFSCHVRHSNKGIEMPLLDFATYGEAVRRTADAQRILNPYVFVSTEDPKVVDDARMTFGARALVVPYNRTNPSSLEAHMAGGANETLHGLLNLWISLESTYFIGQHGSNWNRLIDELRRIWPGESHDGCCTRYTEVGCGQPQCSVDTNNW
jgi:hypothetical protein